jgi:hypothetical protein
MSVCLHSSLDVAIGTSKERDANGANGNVVRRRGKAEGGQLLRASHVATWVFCRRHYQVRKEGHHRRLSTFYMSSVCLP